jgi:putative sigma-54 modulation protein
MKVTYTGKQRALLPAQQRKLDAKIAKIAKVVDSPKSEKEAHVILSNERHLVQAEVTVDFYDHRVVGIGTDTDQFAALSEAFEKLEKQLLKLRGKWRDSKRGNNKSAWSEEAEAEAPEAVEEETSAGGHVFRLKQPSRRKPMTLDEALLEMENGRDYLVYMDAETDKLSVLIRRRDGNFDLVQP